MCDLIVCSEDAVFQNPVLRMTGAGVEALVELRGMTPRMAKAFLWTGNELDAQEAHRQLLVNEVVPLVDLEAKTMSLAERIAKLPPVTAQNVKRSINHAEDLAGFRHALEYHFMVHQFQHNTKTSLDALAARMEKGSMKEVFTERDETYGG
jgi:enoyl-CoA hydratase